MTPRTNKASTASPPTIPPTIALMFVVPELEFDEGGVEDDVGELEVLIEDEVCEWVEVEEGGVEDDVCELEVSIEEDVKVGSANKSTVAGDAAQAIYA